MDSDKDGMLVLAFSLLYIKMVILMLSLIFYATISFGHFFLFYKAAILGYKSLHCICLIQLIVYRLNITSGIDDKLPR